LIKRGENAVASGHMKEFGYDANMGRIYGCIEASMKHVMYKCEVGTGSPTRLCCIYRKFGRLLSCV